MRSRSCASQGRVRLPTGSSPAGCGCLEVVRKLSGAGMEIMGCLAFVWRLSGSSPGPGEWKLIRIGRPTLSVVRSRSCASQGRVRLPTGSSPGAVVWELSGSCPEVVWCWNGDQGVVWRLSGSCLEVDWPWRLEVNTDRAADFECCVLATVCIAGAEAAADWIIAGCGCLQAVRKLSGSCLVLEWRSGSCLALVWRLSDRGD